HTFNGMFINLALMMWIIIVVKTETMIRPRYILAVVMALAMLLACAKSKPSCVILYEAIVEDASSSINARDVPKTDVRKFVRRVKGTPPPTSDPKFGRDVDFPECSQRRGKTVVLWSKVGYPGRKRRALPMMRSSMMRRALENH
ncbi:unnamed protein product, partial [Owenia fusiformis]